MKFKSISTKELENYVKHYNTIFKTNLNNSDKQNISLLLRIYEMILEEADIPTKENQELRSNLLKLSEQIESSLNDNQKEMFYKYWELENQMIVTENKQIFLFILCTVFELVQELNIK